MQTDFFTEIEIKDKKVVKLNDTDKIITKLRNNAQSLLKRAENINTGVSGNWTYRRQRFADNAYSKKSKLEKDAIALNRLADLWEVGQCPDILINVRGASDFEAYYPKPVENFGGWYEKEYPSLLKRAKKIGLTSNEDNKLFNEEISKLSVIVLTAEQQKALELKEALKKVHAMNIPGFFPTPDKLIERLINLSVIKENMSILEPSAGIGSIVDMLVNTISNVHITCIEQQWSLAEILTLKGYATVRSDIMEYSAPTNDNGIVCGFDRIIMNPPFEKGQDVEHVTHCFNTFLKEGGRLVSIMSASVLFNSNSKYEKFRELVEEYGYFEKVEKGAFKDAFNSTGVSVCIVVLNKSS